MKIKQAFAAIVAASLVSTPVIAQAASVEAARIGSPISEGENIQGGWFIPALALLAVLLGVLVIAQGGDDDLPTSP